MVWTYDAISHNCSSSLRLACMANMHVCMQTHSNDTQPCLKNSPWHAVLMCTCTIVHGYVYTSHSYVHDSSNSGHQIVCGKLLNVNYFSYCLPIYIDNRISPLYWPCQLIYIDSGPFDWCVHNRFQHLLSVTLVLCFFPLLHAGMLQTPMPWSPLADAVVTEQKFGFECHPLLSSHVLRVILPTLLQEGHSAFSSFPSHVAVHYVYK